MEMVKQNYKTVEGYAMEELFVLTQQANGAAAFLPANIAKGMGRNYKKDTIQFLDIARSALYGRETLPDVAHWLGIRAVHKFIVLNDRCIDACRCATAG